LKLLFDIARGVKEYLSSTDSEVHGSIKPDNIFLLGNIFDPEEISAKVG
jgi:hypothetical protein